MTRPMRPLIPPPPGTKKAEELKSIEADIFDALLVIQELLTVGGARCITLAAGGMVNIVTGEDHPAEAAAERPEDPAEVERIARAIFDGSAEEAHHEWDRADQFQRADFLAFARSAMAALKPPAAVVPPKPVIKRFLGINLIESLLAAGAAGYEQIERVGRHTQSEEIKASVQAFIDHVKKIREVRTKRIVAP